MGTPKQFILRSTTPGLVNAKKGTTAIIYAYPNEPRAYADNSGAEVYANYYYIDTKGVTVPLDRVRRLMSFDTVNALYAAISSSLTSTLRMDRDNESRHKTMLLTIKQLVETYEKGDPILDSNGDPVLDIEGNPTYYTGDGTENVLDENGNTIPVLLWGIPRENWEFVELT